MWRLIFRYALFAVVATLINLATQRAVLTLFGTGPGFGLAIFCGTATGLLAKYVLDKRWIFFDNMQEMRREGRQFALYTLTGIGTTLLFWGTESVFWFVWRTEAMRELGAVLGLAVGYVVKYRLDRRFVFTDAALHRSAAA